MARGTHQGSDDPLFRSEAVAEQEERWLGSVLMTPHASYTILTAVVVLLVSGVIWLLALGEFTRKARLVGWLAPERGLIEIVAPQAGVLTQVTAQEGLEVAAGAPLAVLSAERRSEMVGATGGEVVRALRARRDSLIEERDRQRSLFAAQARAQAARSAMMMTELQAMEREMELQNTGVELAEAALARQRSLRAREIVITAPHAGTLTALRATSGGGVGVSDPLMTLVPAGARLEARLYGPSRAIGFVRPGQRVRLRYDAFPHQKFGQYTGTVKTVSRTTVSAAELAAGRGTLEGLAVAADEPVYRVTVTLDTQSATAYGAPAALQPGMTIEADVLIETRRVYQWVLDPLYALRGGASA